MVKHHLWKLIVAVILAGALVAPGVSAMPMVFQSPPPSPSCTSPLCLTIDPNGTFDARTGIATIHGTLTCTMRFDYLYSQSGYLQQKVGRLNSVEGSFYPSPLGPCPGITAWSARVLPYRGGFAGGSAYATASIYGYGYYCDPYGWCNYYSQTARAEGTVKLKGH